MDSIQRGQMKSFQKTLFGKEFYESQKGDLYYWIVTIMRQRGCSYWHICFYLAGIDVDGVEKLVKLLIQSNNLHQNYTPHDLK